METAVDSVAVNSTEMGTAVDSVAVNPTQMETAVDGEAVMSIEMETAVVGVPVMSTPTVIDFRFLDEGLGGPRNNPKTKRKREEDEEAAAVELTAEWPSQMRSRKRPAFIGEGDRPIAGKPTYDGVQAGKISGRKWKQPKTCRAAALRQVGRKTTLEEKNRVRAVKKAYKERLTELKEQIRLNKRAKREQIETRKKIKKENELRSTPVQRITNPKTLKKMSKKQRKLLRIIPD